jgi:magnesium transporter
MLKKYTQNDFIWIDLELPTNEEVRSLVEEYDIHPLVANELLSPTLRSRVDVYDSFIYLILHFPTVVHSHHNRKEEEVDFIVGKNYIITTHYGTVDTLHEFSKLFEVGSLLEKRQEKLHGGLLFFYMMRHFYLHMERELDQLSSALSEIEKNIFDGKEHKMVRRVSEESRKLLHFKKALESHHGILASFEAAGKKLFGAEFEYYVRSISGEYYKIENNLSNYIETLNELRTTNDSLLTTKTNDIMRILTIMAFVTFPLSLFASLFGMNTLNTPVIGHQEDFWIIISFMVIATVGFFLYFKYKKWL